MITADALNAVRCSTHIHDTTVKIHIHTLKLFWGNKRKISFGYFSSVLHLCKGLIGKLFALSFPINKVIRFEVRGACWPQTTTDNSVLKYFPQSIHGCPCCMTVAESCWKNAYWCSLSVSFLINGQGVCYMYLLELIVS